jgi:glycosyltransferase involved in cell wall biosynthesis
MPRLSIIVITKNEAANIGACLDSVAFADEIVVVDDSSTDGTAAIAAAKGARVLDRKFDGFGAQKAFALSQAAGDWVLSIDADERATPALAAEIAKAMNDASVNGFELPRLSSFCDRQMRHSGWYPDYVLRLFRRGKARFSEARFSDDLVHERIICDGKVERLRNDLLHAPVARLEDALSRMDRYSTAGAAMTVARGKRVSFSSGITHGLWSFFRTYILRGGILDGREGFLLAVANAEGTYYRYMKAWLAARSTDGKP